MKIGNSYVISSYIHLMLLYRRCTRGAGGPRPSPPPSRATLIWGFDYNSTKYNFKKTFVFLFKNIPCQRDEIQGLLKPEVQDFF